VKYDIWSFLGYPPMVRGLHCNNNLPRACERRWFR
jgi:hypothetical protein